jgi:hypothetical protein
LRAKTIKGDYRYLAHMLQRRATDVEILGKEGWDVDGTSQKHLWREAGTSSWDQTFF